MSKVEMTLKIVTPPPSGWFERVMNALPEPVTVKAEVPNFLPGALFSGENAPLKVSLGAL